MTTPPYAPRFEVRLSGVTMAADLAGQVLGLTVETDLDLAGSFSLTLRNPVYDATQYAELRELYRLLLARQAENLVIRKRAGG